jgi:hypothetical protein
MAAEDPTALRTPRDVNEAMEILARAFEMPAGRVAAVFGLDVQAFAAAVDDAVAASSRQKEPFLFHWTRAALRAALERDRAQRASDAVNAVEAEKRIRALAERFLDGKSQSSATVEATAMASQMDDLIGLVVR